MFGGKKNVIIATIVVQIAKNL